MSPTGRTRKPAVQARRNAQALLAERHAAQLAAMRADEADLAEFVECQSDLDAASARLDLDLGRAGRHHEQQIAAAMVTLRSTLEGRSGARRSGDGASVREPLTVLSAALDRAAATHRATVLAATTEYASATKAVRGRQGDCLHRLRSRMSLADLASATDLPTARVSALIKQRTRDTPPVEAETPDIGEVGAPASVGSVEPATPVLAPQSPIPPAPAPDGGVAPE